MLLQAATVHLYSLNVKSMYSNSNDMAWYTYIQLRYIFCGISASYDEILLVLIFFVNATRRVPYYFRVTWIFFCSSCSEWQVLPMVCSSCIIFIMWYLNEYCFINPRNLISDKSSCQSSNFLTHSYGLTIWELHLADRVVGTGHAFQFITSSPEFAEPHQ